MWVLVSIKSIVAVSIRCLVILSVGRLDTIGLFEDRGYSLVSLKLTLSPLGVIWPSSLLDVLDANCMSL